jgi:hypothetical protein
MSDIVGIDDEKEAGTEFPAAGKNKNPTRAMEGIDENTDRYSCT